MPSLSFISLSRSDKSFQVGLILVVLFAVVEFFAASIHFIGRTRPAQPAVAAPRVAPAPLSSVAPSAPPVALAVASPTAALTPATSTISVADRLREQADAARGSGDTGRALPRFKGPAQRGPRNTRPGFGNQSDVAHRGQETPECSDRPHQSEDPGFLLRHRGRQRD